MNTGTRMTRKGRMHTDLSATQKWDIKDFAKHHAEPETQNSKLVTCNRFMSIIFETTRLIVRQFTENDKDNFFLLSGNETVMQYIRPVSTKEESDKFLLENIAAYEKNPNAGRWAVMEKANGTFAGSFAIIPMLSQPENIQLGYSLRVENWGRGFATELTKTGLDYFMKHYSHPVIHGITEVLNAASQKVLLKAGFQPAGSFMEEEKELLMFVVKRND